MRIRFLQPAKNTPEPLSIPMVLTRISAGFPSPADEYLEDALDLNELMVARPTSTFFVRVEGDSMINIWGCHPSIPLKGKVLCPTSSGAIADSGLSCGYPW